MKAIIHAKAVTPGGILDDADQTGKHVCPVRHEKGSDQKCAAEEEKEMF